jgi:hypothetical protein
MNRLKRRGIANPLLLGDCSDLNFQLKKFKDPEAGFWGYFEAIKPVVREVTERISAAVAAVLLAPNPIDSIVAIIAAKNAAFFPANLTEVQIGLFHQFSRTFFPMVQGNSSSITKPLTQKHPVFCLSFSQA